MIWAKMPSGRWNPLDIEEVKPEAGRGVSAFNPRTGGAVPVVEANLEMCARWVEQGVTFHVSHWVTCPERDRVRREVDERRGVG